MSPAGTAILGFVRRARATLRRDGAVAVAALWVASAAACLIAAWLLAGTRAWAAPSAGPALLLAAVLAVLAVVLAAGVRRWVAAVDDRSVAAAVEEARAWPEGRLRGLIELAGGVPGGTSEALYRRAEAELAGELRQASARGGTGELGARAARRRRRALAGAGALAVVATALGLAAPERAAAGWQPMVHPVAYLTPPPMPPLVVRPGDASVRRGERLGVEIEAGRRGQAVLHWRATGDVPRSTPVELVAGRGSAALGPVDAALVYWVDTPDGARSDSFRVTPVDPLLLRSLTLRVDYPAYLGRDPDRYENEVPPLVLPAGSMLELRGSATRVLGAGSLVDETAGDTIDLITSGDRLVLDWRPRRSGSYMWVLTDTDGRPPGLLPTPLDITVVADAFPVVSIVSPGTDTVLPLSMQQPITAEARDDYGVIAADLVSWRVSALGDAEPRHTRPLRLDEARERVLLSDVLDATDRRMLPGDTLRYFIRVTDNTPAGQTAESRTYALRLPSLVEMRERTVDEAEALAGNAEGAVAEARRLESRVRDLSRSSARRSQAGRESPSQSQRLAFDEAQEARQALDEQESMLERVEALRQQAETLRRAIEDAGLQDPELQQRLDELAALYEELAGGELREQLDRLREALNRMDAAAVQEALQRIAERQQEFREGLEQSLELMRRAAAEHQMNALARTAEETAAQEEALSRAMATEDSAQDDPQAPERAQRRADQQDDLAGRTRELAAELDHLRERLEALGEERAASSTDTASAQASSASGRMSQAAEAAAGDRSAEAAQHGAQASRELADAAQRLNAARQEMASSWREAVQQAMDQATRDALAMAEQQEALRRRMEEVRSRGGATEDQIQAMQAQQAALQQGLEQLARNLGEAAQRSAMVDRDVGTALGRTMNTMGATQQGLVDRAGRRDLPSSEAGQSVDALNRLALSLMRNADRVAASESGTGVEQALQELAELARQQSAVNSRSGALAPMELDPQTLARQLQALAGEQRGIAEQLSQMQRSGEGVLGDLDAMGQEADRLARELGGGRLTPDVLRRQERLFHRLLDAGRSLERDELSEERRAERPGVVEPARAETLDPRLQDTALRFPPPDAEALRNLPPAYRLLILQYFDRLNRAAAGEPPGGGGR